MIIKQEEWDALVNAKDLLEKKYTQRLQDKSEEITKLKGEISKLQKAIKPDEISIYACKYLIDPTNKYPINVHLSNTLYPIVRKSVR